MERLLRTGRKDLLRVEGARGAQRGVHSVRRDPLRPSITLWVMAIVGCRSPECSVPTARTSTRTLGPLVEVAMLTLKGVGKSALTIQFIQSHVSLGDTSAQRSKLTVAVRR